MGPMSAEPRIHRRVNVSLMQIDVEALQPQRNIARMAEFADAEARSGANLIVFPELANTGYVEPVFAGATVGLGCPDTREYGARLYAAAEGTDGPLRRTLSKIAQDANVMIVVGAATQHPLITGLLYNSSLLFGPEGMVSSYHKLHLCQMEKLYFVPGEHLAVRDSYWGRIGMQICYDIRFPEVTRRMTLEGAELVTNIWSSFSEPGSREIDVESFRARPFTRAHENGVFFLSCNRVGVQSGVRFCGHSVIASPTGRIVAASSSDSEAVVRAEIDLGEVARYRASVGVLTDRRRDIYG
jgi:omega-amidase